MTRAIFVAVLALTTSAHAQFGLARRPAIRAEAVPPDVAAIDPEPAFPLRFHILVTRWGGLAWRNHGYGSANLLDATAPKGFDFAYECDYPFTANETPDQNYQARWKKQPYELEILTSEVGTGKLHTCKLHLAPEVRPFDLTNTARYTHGVSSSLRVVWRDPDFAYEVPAPDYPVQFHVLDGERREDSAGDHGWGTANLADPSTHTPLQGADYHYDCNFGFLTSSQLQNYYQGHWIKPGQKLELLLQRPGSDKVDKCEVVVDVHPQPYPERRPLGQPSQSQQPSAEPTLIRPTAPML
jgi:hypothetical protein